MTDLIHLMSTLVKGNGDIQIAGILDQVAPLTEAEKGLYNGIDFKMAELYDAIGSETSIYSDEKSTLMHRLAATSCKIN